MQFDKDTLKDAMAPMYGLSNMTDRKHVFRTLSEAQKIVFNKLSKVRVTIRDKKEIGQTLSKEEQELDTLVDKINNELEEEDNLYKSVRSGKLNVENLVVEDLEIYRSVAARKQAQAAVLGTAQAAVLGTAAAAPVKRQNRAANVAIAVPANALGAGTGLVASSSSFVQEGAERKFQQIKAILSNHNEVIKMALASPNFTENEKNYISKTYPLSGPIATTRASTPPPGAAGSGTTYVRKTPPKAPPRSVLARIRGYMPSTATTAPTGINEGSIQTLMAAAGVTRNQAIQMIQTNMKAREQWYQQQNQALLLLPPLPLLLLLLLPLLLPLLPVLYLILVFLVLFLLLHEHQDIIKLYRLMFLYTTSQTIVI